MFSNKWSRLWFRSAFLLPLVVMMLESNNNDNDNNNNMLVSHSWMIMTPNNNNFNNVMKHKVSQHPQQQQQQQRSITHNHPLSSTANADATETENSEIVPIILLSGFLGSGKTTTLKHLLENKEGKKLGVIVNDVASVNIDAKLVARHQQEQNQQLNDDNNNDYFGLKVSKDNDHKNIEMIELQNGCACCTLSKELITSVNQMLNLKKSNNDDDDKWDAIVVELSGVADPVATKWNWKDAKLKQIPGTNQADITRVVTLIDACTFGTDWMSWDTASDRKGWVADPSSDHWGHHCSDEKNVPELLAEQVEAADLLLVNKLDISGKEQADIASSVARGINEKAKLLQIEFGKVSPQEILYNSEEVAAKAKAQEEKEEDKGNDAETEDLGDLARLKVSELKELLKARSLPVSGRKADLIERLQQQNQRLQILSSSTTTDSNHSSQDNKQLQFTKLKVPELKDMLKAQSLPVSGRKSHLIERLVENAGNDEKNGFQQEENVPSTSTTGISNTLNDLGISSFVYKATRPFQSNRLMSLLSSWPVPIKDVLDLDIINAAKEEGYDVHDGENYDANPFVGVLRSKGYCWISPRRWFGHGEEAWRHDTAMFWSHAGKHFDISKSGQWWATVSRKKMKSILAKTSSDKEYKRIIQEDFVTDEFGDRRQELVFIGANINQEAIIEALNECLVTDEELDKYRQKARKYELGKKVQMSESSRRRRPLDQSGGRSRIENMYS